MTDGLTPQETSVDDEASVVATDEDVSAGVVSDGAYSLFIADFADTDSAWATYEDLKAAAAGLETTGAPSKGRSSSVPYMNKPQYTATASTKLAKGPATTMAMRFHTVCRLKLRCAS